MHVKRSIALTGAALLIVTGCARVSPRPNTMATEPPAPAGVVPLGEITWSAVTVPGGLPEGTNIEGAAAGPSGFVLVGDSGALAFQGVVVRSADGRTWETVHDPDLVPWALSEVIATDSGFIAVGSTSFSARVGRARS